MPEGPEIRRAADRIADAIAGQPVVVRFAFPALQPYEARLHLRRVQSVTPRGKALLTAFEPDADGRRWTIYSHNQLYGVWQIVSRDGAPTAAQPDETPVEATTSRQLRLGLYAHDRAALLYSASDIAVWDSDRLPAHPYLARLGIELLDPATTQEAVEAQIAAPRFARKNLAALLLDQAFLAGVGNYLRSDILFVARLSPQRTPGSLGVDERAALAAAALSLTRRSYHTAGVTNNVERAAQLKHDGWPYRRYRHWVFDRAGEACHLCSATIVRETWTGRALFRCPGCQVPA